MQDQNKIDSENINEKKTGLKNNLISLSKRTIAYIIIICVIFSALFGSVFGFFTAGLVTILSPSIAQKLHQRFPDLIGTNIGNEDHKQQVIVEDSAVIDVVKKSTPAVVSIVISKNVPNSPSNSSSNAFNPFGLNFPHMQGSQNPGSSMQRIGEGSGFFISSDGLIMTNRHVVDDSQATYTVRTNEGKELHAAVLATDPVRDIAIIRVDGYNFPTLTLGDSDSVQIGQTIIAIGNSLGEFSNSVSRGVVAGLKRNLNAGSDFGSSERLTDIIQTDAAINPGNSGGPLIDVSGKVVGINVAMAQGAQNIGFALPINQAKKIIDQVKTGKKISVPYIGIRYLLIDSNLQKQAKLPFEYGVLVARGSNKADLAVIPGSPADIAGLAENDIILEVNGEKITKENQLEDIIAKYNVGDNISLKIWRKGQINNVNVTLQELKK